MRLALVAAALAIAGAALWPAPARPDCFNRTRYVAPAYYDPVVTEIAVAQFVPLPVFVPQYSVTVVQAPAPVTAAPAPVPPQAPVSVAPPGQPVGGGELDERLLLRREIERLRAELAACQAKLTPAPQPQPVAPPAPNPPPPQAPGGAGGNPPGQPLAAAAPLVSAAGKCYHCHREDQAKTRGGNFVMFDRNNLLAPAKFSPGQQVKILTKTSLGQMPPVNNKDGVAPLTDEEAAAFQRYFSGAP